MAHIKAEPVASAVLFPCFLNAFLYIILIVLLKYPG